MSSRPLLAPFPAITNGDMSGDITSKITIIQNLSMASYDVSWAGSSPVGTLDLQVSNTYTQNADGTVRNAGNWTSVPLTVSPSVSGSSGTGFIDIESIGGYAIRLVYTRTSGTGLLQAVLIGKVS